MLRHAQYVSVNRNFRPTPVPNRDLHPLPRPAPYALPVLCAPCHIAAVRPTGACRALPYPTIPYSRVSRETDEHQPTDPKERGDSDTRLGCLTRSSLRSVRARPGRCAPYASAYMPIMSPCRLPAVGRGSVLPCFT